MSRPRRTRLYDANYQIGQSYYKPTLERLDRKYSGRPLDAPKIPPSKSPSIARDILERHEKAFAEEDLFDARNRAAKHISEDNIFDSRGGVIPRNGKSLSVGLNGESEFDDEVAAALNRIRANRKEYLKDIDLESTVTNVKSRRAIDLQDKILDSVGITNEISNQRESRGISALKSRRAYVDEELEPVTPLVQKWSALTEAEDVNSGAAQRARQSRARLQDLEDEMDAMNERHAARDRRVAQLKKLVADSDDFSESGQLLQSAMKSTRAVSTSREKKTVTF